MQQVKIFKSIESEVDSLEQAVNTWIRENDVKVVNIFGNIAPQTVSEDTSKKMGGRAFSPSDLLLVVVYEAG